MGNNIKRTRRATDADMDPRTDSNSDSGGNTSSIATPRTIHSLTRRWSTHSNSPLTPKTPRITIFRSEIEISNMQQQKEEVRILLLGNSETGKSTLFKQLKLMYRGRYDLFERRKYRDKIFRSILQSIRTLVAETISLHDPINPFITKMNRDRAKHLLGIDHSTMKNISSVWTDVLVDDIEALWNDDAVQETFQLRGRKFHIHESVSYFLDNLYRFKVQDYVPSDTDVLMYRSRTKNFEELVCETEIAKAVVIDTGGTRDQRRKWKLALRGINVVVFVVSLSDFAYYCNEDPTRTRMEESLFSFTSLVNKTALRRVPFVLVLNQVDLLQDALERVPLHKNYPYYDGGNSLINAIIYIKETFTSKYYGTLPNKIYTIVTNFKDTDQVQKTFDFIMNVATKNLKDYNFDDYIFIPRQNIPQRSWKYGKHKMLTNISFLDISITTYHGTYEQCIKLRMIYEDRNKFLLQQERRKLMERIEEKRKQILSSSTSGSLSLLVSEIREIENDANLNDTL
jgi:GTPase SAR1 family protein